MLIFAFSRVELWISFISYSSLSYVMKNKRNDHIKNITSKCHDVFAGNFKIFFFKCRKNLKRARIRICQILEDHLLEMI